MVLSHDEVKEVQAALQQDDLHPLRRLFLEAAAEESNPMDFECEDRGTWKGSWPLPSRSQTASHESSWNYVATRRTRSYGRADSPQRVQVGVT